MLDTFEGATTVEVRGELYVEGLIWIHGERGGEGPELDLEQNPHTTSSGDAQTKRAEAATEPPATGEQLNRSWSRTVEDIDVWELDPESETRTWLKEVLVADPEAFVDPLDVLEGFTAGKKNLVNQGVTVVDLETEEVAALIRDVFAGTELVESDEVMRVDGVQGVRWAALEGGKRSVALHFLPLEEGERREAQRLVRSTLIHLRVRIKDGGSAHPFHAYQAES